MKNYVISALLVVILVLVSIIFKIEKKTSPRDTIPVSKDMVRVNVEVPLFLYVFFSDNNCFDCLEIIQTLNTLPSHFVVCGIVPQRQLDNEKRLRKITGATFQLMSSKKYKRYIPWYVPSIMGISPEGDILFVLPGVPKEKQYLLDFLDALYEKIYPVFLKKKISKKNKE